MKTRLMTAAIVLSCGAAASADVLNEGFQGGIPSTWTTVDYQPGGSGVLWGTNADTGRGNYTGGEGQCAMADSAAGGDGIEFDIALLTPVLHLPVEDHPFLTFKSNYQNFAGSDFADVDIDAGGGWTNLLRWNEDHGDSFFRAIGEEVSIDLGAFSGSDVQVRFHYYDPGASDWDWYWQIDDVGVTPAPGALGLLAAGGLLGARRRRRS